MKYRFLGNSYCYLWVMPFSGFGPATAYAFVVNTRSGWRWCYYLMIICNAMCLPCWYFFYHPPTFRMKHGAARKLKFIKEFDYAGTSLFTAGLVVFLMGLSWGGSVHPWKSAGVIAPMILEFFTLVAFVVYEIEFPLEEPLVPVHVFKNRGFTASTLLLGIGASIYYAFSVVW